MVAVEVGTGDEAQTFHVHAAQLCKSSEYLKTKAKPEWSKGKATVDLSYQDPGAFNIYVNWLYTGQILSTNAKKSNTSEEWLGLARAFTLGEELIDQDFKNAIMRCVGVQCVVLATNVADSSRIRPILTVFLVQRPQHDRIRCSGHRLPRPPGRDGHRHLRGLC